MPTSLTQIDLNLLRAVNRFSLCNVQTGLFPNEKNTQATVSSPAQSRSESTIVINPRNPLNMIGASKKFIEPAVYLFTIGVIYTFDRGNSWQEAELPMKAGWDGLSDPVLAFDNFGNAFLVCGPIKFNQAFSGRGDSHDLTGLGTAVYRSSDGGVSWSEPILLGTDERDDKQWIICDNSPYSPFYGTVYVAWGAHAPLRFARSTNHGQSWHGKANEPAGSDLTDSTYAPELSVSADGTLHILWHFPGTSTIEYMRSTDGGNSFEKEKPIVTGVKSLKKNALPEVNEWPHFANGKFRVLTLLTSCVASGHILIAAWADMRDGRSRIYYARSLNNGRSWEAEKPLLPHVNYGDIHCFHPQIIATKTGVIGCAFYTFGKFNGRYGINLQLAASWDDGATFSYFITVTDQPWDPLINAPAVHGDANVHFIGEYFGLDAAEEEFALLWTDTRTGVQELFSDVIQTKKVTCPHLPEMMGQVFGGVTVDGGGFIIVGGKVVKVPPRSPVIQVLEALAALELAAENEATEELQEIQLAALQTAARLLNRQIAKIKKGR